MKIMMTVLSLLFAVNSYANSGSSKGSGPNITKENCIRNGVVIRFTDPYSCKVNHGGTPESVLKPKK